MEYGEEDDEYGSDEDFGSDQADFSDDDGGQMFMDEETKTQFTNYSVSSSVMRRNEGLTLLDDRFEKVNKYAWSYTKFFVMRSEGLILLEDRLEDIEIFIIILYNEGEMKNKYCWW